ncbi:MAG TPA: protein kinase [Candidatus Polarisedimenticolia bacterium]|jgi:serine/threonine-protein kinase|nr:protein kinase [Candidatus Polarisedimenticolia bacterium]
MPLLPGTKIGVYELVGPLGAGGMGEVWRARDTRLQRDVAIKVLPEALATEPERLGRLMREAQALASLNHPNIAQIHGLEESGGIRALVMELVDGDDLSVLIARGAMPVGEALPIARQIAEALEAAHEQGIIHRDLKPANVKVRRDGTVKVLDFGLAKVMDPLASASGSRPGGELGLSPTLTAQATRAGVILGTAAYMSPEQARGRAVDRRADVWAFGAVLYEMLTGRRAFEGEDVSFTLANVLKESVDWSPLPGDLPPGVRRLLRRCLEKDPRRRLASMADARLEMEDTETAGATIGATSAAASAPARRGLSLPLALGLAAAAALATAALMFSIAPAPAARKEAGVTRLSVALPENDVVMETNRGPVAVSPDGSMIAFVGSHGGVQQLLLRRLTDPEPVPLPGTEGAVTPFFSPDGQWIAFFAQMKLKRIAVGGAALQTITPDVPDPRGGTWGSDGVIYYSPTNMSGLYKVPASGGTGEPLTTLDPDKGEISHRWPQVLPDGKSLLFTIWTGPGNDERRIVMQTIATGARHDLVTGGDSARYLPGGAGAGAGASATGHLLYGRTDNLFAIPWQPTVTDLSGAVPVTMPEHPRLENEGSSAYDVSASGTLVYLPGGAGRYLQRIVWTDHAGRTEPLPLPERDYGSVALSPDGRRAAVQVSEGTIGIWIYDFEHQTFTPFPTGPGSSQAPVWTPDGRRILYRATRHGQRDIYIKAADGTGDEVRLTAGVGRALTPTSISPDGQWLVFSGLRAMMGGESMIWRLRLDHAGEPGGAGQPGGAAQPEPMLPLSPARVNGAQVSPDGRSMSYASDISGRMEIYVMPFPGPGASQQISVDGGYESLWARDGRTLFFQNNAVLMAVDVAPGTPPRFGRPRRLYEGRYRRSPNGNTPWSLSPDSQRFLRIQQAQSDPPTDRIDVVLGWGEQVSRGAAGR